MIEFNNLSIGYDQPLSQKFSFTIESNKWFGIIGQNGCGKSTLLKTILGTIKPLSGSIKILGKNIGNSNNSIAYIPQEREINTNNYTSGLSLIKLSYNGWHFGIPLYPKKIHERALRLIELVGATNYMHQPFHTLSGGQKKRIYLVQALINKPQVLLLDEPLADLDPQARQHFIEALDRIHAEHELTLLIISHDMHEINSYLNGFIHFKQNQVHFCKELPCIKEAAYVGL